MILGLSFLASWSVIALAVVLVILFYKVLDLSTEAFRQWWDAVPGQDEDSTANQERER